MRPVVRLILLVATFVLSRGGSGALAQDAVRSQPDSTESSDLFPPAGTPPPAVPPGNQILPDAAGPPSDARHPWEDSPSDVPALLSAANAARPPTLFRPAAGPAELVVDRAAAAFDPTGLGFGRGLPGGAFTAGSNPPFHLGPLALHATAGASALVEKESGAFSRTRGWTAGTQLFGTLDALVGQPLMNRYLEVQYAGSYQLGGRSEYDETFDQAVSLNGHYDFAHLKLLLTGDYTHLTGPDRDVGLVVDRDLLAFKFDATYPLSLRSSLDWSVSESSSEYAHAISSTDVRTSLFFERHLGVKTRLDLGGTVGTLQVESGDAQSFEQFNLRANYVPDTKFVLAAMVGYEWRQLGDTDTGTPVFDGSISYAVRPTTSLSLGASRSVTDSATAAQSDYVSSTVQVAATQKIGTKLAASLSLGYENADYRFTDRSPDGDREDNYLFIRPGATQTLNDFFSLFAFYSYGKNFSNQRAFQTQQFSLGGRASF